MKKKIKKIFYILYYLFLRIETRIYKDHIFLVGTPIHGNLGDQAIVLAEEKFLKDNYSSYKIIKVESSFINNNINLLKKIVDTNLILIQGGGFLGTLWLNEEKMFRKIVCNFPDNNIIVFPQTVYFDNDEGVLNESQNIYASHNNLYFFLREKYSYEFMKKKFPTCNVFLVPDMVLYLKSFCKKGNKSGILFCLRHDKEKNDISTNRIDEFSFKLDKKLISYTDTVVKKNIYFYNRKREVIKKLKEFSNYECIITDRLHGMIFALLSNTPCIVFENSNYKISGVYDWIKDYNHIKMANELTPLNDIPKQLNVEKRYKGLDNEFTPLIKLIKEKL